MKRTLSDKKLTQSVFRTFHETPMERRAEDDNTQRWWMNLESI